MSPTRAGFLVGLFALLVVVYLGLEWRSRQVEEREAAAKRLFDIKVEQVTGVRLERPDGPAVRLARSADGRWRIVEPRELRADQGNVERVVRSAVEATRERVLEGADPSAPQYGLATPAVTVTLETASGPRRLALGADAPVGGAAYARVGDGATVVLVPSYVKTDAMQSLFDLRDKRIVDVAADQLRRVEVRPVRADGPPVVLVKEADRWRLEGAPPGRQVDQFKADRLVDAAIGLRMTEVLSEDRSAAKSRGLEPPVRTVALTLASGSGPTIELGAAVDEKKGGESGGSGETRKGTAVAVAGQPGVYLVDTAQVAPLAWKPEELLAPPPTPSPSPSPGASPSPSPTASASPSP